MMRSRQHTSPQVGDTDGIGAHGEAGQQSALPLAAQSRRRRGGAGHSHKTKKTSLSSLVFLFLSFVGLSIIIGWLYLTHSVLSNSNNHNINNVIQDSSSLAGANNNNNNENNRHGPPEKVSDFIRKPASNNNNDNGNNVKQGKNVPIEVASSDDQIVEALLQLADMPVNELQTLLEGNESHKNMFQIDQLQQGICPWSATKTVLPWLPPKKSMDRSNRLKSEQNQNPKRNEPVVAIYYEHLSKAGGTSFCKLAQSNMEKKIVPHYYCMPSKPKMPDARVGSWPVQELEDYFVAKPHRIVSNEWEPFNLEYLPKFAPETNSKVQLVFVTSIRNPINRLLSAHKFWGILHNGAEVKPTLEQWLTRYARRAKRWKVLSGDFTANVGRFNFGVWKFSGGALPLSEANLAAETMLDGAKTNDEAATISYDKFEKFLLTKDQWLKPFETAVRTLSNFDLVIPMEEMSNHPQPVTDILGWKDFSQAHVVPSGKVVNNKASSELQSKEYDLLWQSNALDMILYYWSLAVYLTRLHCAEYLEY